MSFNRNSNQQSLIEKTAYHSFSVQLDHAISVGQTQSDCHMLEIFDPLRALLRILEAGRPADERYEFLCQFQPPQWEALIDEAAGQSLTPYLYRLLVEHEERNDLKLPQKDQLHLSYLSTAVRNTLILHEAQVLLSSLNKVGIAVAGLKGVFLLENVYGDIGARSMNDTDLLLKKQDLSACIEILQGLGYTPSTYFSLNDENTDTKHLPPMQKPGGTLVEVHWTLLEENEPFTIDAKTLWERAMPATIAEVDALALCVEDLILHLCLHLTYQHYLQLGLRSLLDVALVIHKFREEIDWQKLVQIAKSWGSERVTALTLKLVETLLNVPTPAEIYSALVPEGFDSELLENARALLLNREQFTDQLTPDLVDMNASGNILKKIKIGLQRVFLPRIALARIYNVSPSSPRIIGLYWLRLKHLIRNYGGTLRRLQSGEYSGSALQRAETSYSLHEWMTSRNVDVGRN